MKRALLLAFPVWILMATAAADFARAYQPAPSGPLVYRRAQQVPWHGGYYHSAWGQPLALVVPPRAEAQTHWGWGVGGTRITPILHQFGRNYPGPGYYDRRMFRPTPFRPTDTDQFGVYYIRGPW